MSNQKSTTKIGPYPATRGPKYPWLVPVDSAILRKDLNRYTLEHVAEIAGVHPRTVLRWKSRLGLVGTSTEGTKRQQAAGATVARKRKPKKLLPKMRRVAIAAHAAKVRHGKK